MHQQRRDPLEGAVVDGRYVVHSRLARGGMSTVYVATDRRLDRRVALKVLYPHLADEPGFIDRFEQEAKSAARLSHPHVVGVLDQGVDDVDGQAVAYLVMEYVPGRTLRDVLREQGRLTPRHALRFLDDVVEGLAAAHDAGLIHRDVKPENVLLSDTGQVKIADFGLARAVSATTGTATLVGTVAYLSPELVLGRPAEAQSDIYSTGIMLYELLTGRQPFIGETPIQVAIQHAQADVPAPSVLLPGLAPDIDELVLWCTSRDPEERPVDGAALLGELRHIRATLSEADLDFAPAGADHPMAEQDQLTAAVVPHLPLSDDRTELLQRRQEHVPAARSGSVSDSGDAGDARGASDVESRGNPTSVIGRDQSATRVIGAMPAVPPSSSTSSPSSLSPPSPSSPSSNSEATVHLGALPLVADGNDGDRTQILEDVGRQRGPGEPAENPEGRGSAVPKRTKNSRRQQARAAQRPEKSLQGPIARRSFRVLVVLLLLLAGLVAGAGWLFGAGPAGVVALPDVANVPLSDARATLDGEGLASLATEEVFDDEVLAGLVIGTEPGAFVEVRRYQRVDLIVSKGPELFAVPDLTGRSEVEAASELGSLGLTVGSLDEQYSETVAAGEVLRQAPVEGAERRRGSAVDLVVSLGPAPIAVPDVSALSEEDAVEELEAVGLRADISDSPDYSRNVPAGSVLTQSPSGTEVQRGTTVTLTLSLGPRLVRVPNVFSLSEDRAVAALEESGFEVEVDYTFGSSVLGLVAGQSRTGDQPEGTTIRITVT